MSHEPLEDVRRWLAAELSGRPDTAEEVFRRVIRLVPRLEPPSSLTERVLAAVWSAGSPAGPEPVGWFWLRPIVAVSLLLSGLAVLRLSGSVPIPPIGALVGAGVAAFTSVTSCVNRAADAGSAVWHLLGDVGLAARAAVSTPEGSTAVVLNAALALASLLGLRRLLAPLEESR